MDRSSARRRWLDVLRWGLVLPAGYLGCFFGYVLGLTAGYLGIAVGLIDHPAAASSFNRLLRYLIEIVPEGVICIAAAVVMAPRFRIVTAIVFGFGWALRNDLKHWPTAVSTAVAVVCGTAVAISMERRASDGV